MSTSGTNREGDWLKLPLEATILPWLPVTLHEMINVMRLMDRLTDHLADHSWSMVHSVSTISTWRDRWGHRRYQFQHR